MYSTMHWSAIAVSRVSNFQLDAHCSVSSIHDLVVQSVGRLAQDLHPGSPYSVRRTISDADVVFLTATEWDWRSALARTPTAHWLRWWRNRRRLQLTPSQHNPTRTNLGTMKLEKLGQCFENHVDWCNTCSERVKKGIKQKWWVWMAIRADQRKIFFHWVITLCMVCSLFSILHSVFCMLLAIVLVKMKLTYMYTVSQKKRPTLFLW